MQARCIRPSGMVSPVALAAPQSWSGANSINYRLVAGGAHQIIQERHVILTQMPPLSLQNKSPSELSTSDRRFCYRRDDGFAICDATVRHGRRIRLS